MHRTAASEGGYFHYLHVGLDVVLLSRFLSLSFLSSGGSYSATTRGDMHASFPVPAAVSVGRVPFDASVCPPTPCPELSQKQGSQGLESLLSIVPSAVCLFLPGPTFVP